jgi:predicted ATPase/DNA-binding XRE family transcriptional regulator
MGDAAGHAPFGALLRRCRLAAGLTQEELAEQSRVSRRTISDMERGLGHVPRRETVAMLADALHLTGQQRAAFVAARWSPTATAPSSAGAVGLAAPRPLVGRAADVVAIVQLLQRPEVRLLTLTGPPGVGKTSLALAVAAELAPMFDEGVTGVALAPVSDAPLVAATIAACLQIKDAGDRPLAARLSEQLRQREMLLLLDNFEHVLEAAALVGDLLAAAPRLKVLVTSRAALHHYGEQEYPVAPLAVPAAVATWQTAAQLTELARSPAVALFLQRARLIQPALTLTAETAPAVAEICARLEGLPLALELAAARTKLFSPQALAALLHAPSGGGNRLQVLHGGVVDPSGRSRTLRSTLAWSHALLDAREQTVFAGLSVFAGGCTLQAAEAVCAPAGDPAVGPTLDVLAALVDRSLLQRDEGGAPGRAVTDARFTMLEMIREYAHDCLAACADESAVRARHAAYFVAFAEKAVQNARGRPGADQVLWLDRWECEQHNLQAAMRWLLDQSQAAPALRLGAAASWFASRRGNIGEWRAWLAAALALPEAGARTAERAGALRAAGELAWQHNDARPARGLLEQALTLYRDLGDRPGVARVLQVLGKLVFEQDEDEAQRYLEECLAFFQDLGDRYGSAWSLTFLGHCACRRGDTALARARHEESLRLRRAIGERLGIANDLWGLAQAARREGDAEGARALFEEALRQAQAVGDEYHISYALAGLGDLALAVGDGPSARRLLGESLTLFSKAGAGFGVANVVYCFARLALQQGQPAQALRLASAAATLREGIGLPLRAAEQREREPVLAQARELAGTAATAAWALGRVMGVEQMVADALSVDA